MSTIDPKKIAFRGTTNRNLQKHIDNYFTTLGGINPEKLKYTSSNYYYFIDNSGEIIRVDKLPEGYIFQLHTYLTVMKNQEEKIPEYVECVEEQPQYNNYGELGKIYKVLDWNCSITDCLLVGTTSGSTAKKRFKPSTKEAYEAQNTYLKAAEYIPQVGDFVVMEKAGGWGYSPANNGCVALVNRIRKTISYGIEVFSICGEVINPNKDHAVKFSGIPQFEDKEIIFRKALPHEIPSSNVKTEPQQQVEEPKESLTKRSLEIHTEMERKFILDKLKQEPIINSCPVSSESAFPVKALRKQLKIVNFQSVHEIKTVEEKLLKKTKSKLFNI